MALPLRLTFNNADIVFHILSDKPSVNSSKEIDILLNNEQYTLVKTESKWKLKTDNNALNAELVTAIGYAISLRYRI